MAVSSKPKHQEVNKLHMAGKAAAKAAGTQDHSLGLQNHWGGWAALLPRKPQPCLQVTCRVLGIQPSWVLHWGSFSMMQIPLTWVCLVCRFNKSLCTEGGCSQEDTEGKTGPGLGPIQKGGGKNLKRWVTPKALRWDRPDKLFSVLDGGGSLFVL